MKRTRPLWMLLLLTLVLALGACSDQAPAAQENTIAPYELTQQERDLLSAFGLTEDNALALSFQAPAEAKALFIQVSRLEDGVWENVSESVSGFGMDGPQEDLPDSFAGLLCLEENVDRSLSVHVQSTFGGFANTPQGAAPDLEWTMRSTAFLQEAQTIQLDQPIPIALLAYGTGTSMSSLDLQSYFTPEDLAGLALVQAVTVTFSETL